MGGMILYIKTFEIKKFIFHVFKKITNKLPNPVQCDHDGYGQWK